MPAGGVGEIPAVFLEDAPASVADIFGDSDDEDDAEEMELDDILEYFGEDD